MKKQKGLWRGFCSVVVMALGLHAAPAAADSQGIGDGVTGLLGLAAIGSTYYYDDSEGRWMLLKSTTVSYGINGVLRLAFNDHELGTRPNGKGYGFPSGHAGFMAAGSAFLQERYGWKWGVPGWLATGYVSWVRVEITNHHRWRDILAAVAIAQGVAWWLVNPYEGADTSLSVAPIFDPEQDAVGVGLNYNF